MKRFVTSKGDHWDQMNHAMWDPKRETLEKFYNRMCTLGGLCNFEESYIIHLRKNPMPVNIED